jgi:hypothetical protein
MKKTFLYSVENCSLDKRDLHTETEISFKLGFGLIA